MSDRPIANAGDEYRRWAAQERERAAEYARNGLGWMAEGSELMASEYDRLGDRVDAYCERYVREGVRT